MVELRINIKKRQMWFLALLIVAVGFVIAQSPGVSHSPAEITGLDARVNALIDTKMAASKPTMETKFFSVGTLDTWNSGGNPTSLADYSNVYGRWGNRDMIGCHRAINAYCQAQGYSVATGIQGYTCGWSWNQDQPCPDKPGCNLYFFCGK